MFYQAFVMHPTLTGWSPNFKKHIFYDCLFYHIFLMIGSRPDWCLKGSWTTKNNGASLSKINEAACVIRPTFAS